MSRKHLWDRRAVLQTAGAGVLDTLGASRLEAESRADEARKPQGNIKQSS